ncbi:hypothetical protein AAG570_000959 [Ranatra chinensis]|uniref:Uncharacterized protein n=1 Tax=Ranatra chinensis TaxID=642074 RepID=A0ABD0YYK9_9HEMI
MESNLLFYDELQRCRIVLCAMVGVCLAIIIIVTLLCTGLLDATSSDGDGREEELLEPPDMTRPPPPSKYTMGQFSRGAIVANGAPCADIANKILMKYGCAVDAAIAAMICDGVTCPQNMGIGGGFLMTVYLREQAKAYFLNARETAPGAAHFNMFNGRPLLSQIGE